MTVTRHWKNHHRGQSVTFEMVCDQVNTDYPGRAIYRLTGVNGFEGLDPVEVELPPGTLTIGSPCRVTVEYDA